MQIGGSEALHYPATLRGWPTPGSKTLHCSTPTNPAYCTPGPDTRMHPALDLDRKDAAACSIVLVTALSLFDPL